MAKVVYIFPVNSTGTLTVNNGSSPPSLEVFRTATHTTGAGSATATLVVADTGGFAAGDTIYIGDNTSTSSVSSVDSATNITLGAAASWSNNDAVVIKTKSGAGSDAYATIYDDPEFSTAITQASQAFTADNDNEWVFYVPPGRYGVRVADSSNATIQLDSDVTWDELDWVQVTPSHDSTTAGIDEAHNKLRSTGGVVYIPPGTYTTTAAVTCDVANVKFIGAGRGQTIIKHGAASTARMFNVTADNVSFENIEFDGNEANATSALQAIRFADVDNTAVRNCYFHDFVGTILWWDYTTTAMENILIENNELTNWGSDGGTASGILIEQSSFIRIANNYLHDAAAAGSTAATNGHAIQIGGTNAGTFPCHYVDCVGNIIDTVGTSGTGAARGITTIGATGSESTNVNYTGNVVRFTEGDALNILSVDYFTMSGNVVVDGDESGCVAASARYGTISGNSIFNSERPGIVIGEGGGGTGKACTDIAIVGNTIINNDAADAYSQGAIELVETGAYADQRMTISGNVIEYASTSQGEYGIKIVSTTGNELVDFVISNNIIKNAGTDGILVTFAKNVLIDGNRITGCAGDGIGVDNTTDCVISNNDVSGNTTQAIDDNGTNTRLKIGFNLTGTTENTAMSGTGTLSGGGTLTIPASGTNPYIRADGTMMLVLQYGETPGAGTYLYPSTLSAGSFVATGAASKKIIWRILEVGSTA